MIQHTGFKAVLALALLACVTVSGCVVVPDQRHYPGGVVMLAPSGAAGGSGRRPRPRRGMCG